jgi:hypothetical protein
MPLDQPGIIAILKRIHLFQGVDDPRLEAASLLIEQAEFRAGQFIYQQGSPADYFYIIVEGRVQFSRYNNRTRNNIPMGILEDTDYFGEEMLEADWPRQLTAEAVTDVLLLRISVQQFVDILDVVQGMAQRLQFILDSYQLMLRTPLQWRDPDEAVLFIARRHVIILAKMLAVPIFASIVSVPLVTFVFLSTRLLSTLVMLVLVCAALLFWLVWNYIDWSNDYYIVTNHRIVYQERVVLMYDSRQESPLGAIQSTTINTSQLGRWIGYGNVAIRTFYGTVFFRDINRPEQVNALIQHEQIRAQFSQRAMSIREIGKFIDSRIREGLIPPPLPGTRKLVQPPDPLRAFISTMFHLRYEQGKTIIYRTHWFNLLQKTWAPSLVLTGLLVVFGISAFNQFAILSLSATCGLIFIVGSIVFGWWFYQYMDWHNDLYLITLDQVVDVDKKPLGQEERQAAPIKNILSIEYKRIGLTGLVLNFGTVYIRVGDRQLTFDNVFRPSEVQRELFHRLSEVKQKEKEDQANEEKQRMGDWVASYNDWLRKNQPPSPPPGTPPPAPDVHGGF